MTYAIKAQKILKSAGIQAQIIKISEDDDDGGCAYGLTILYTEYYSAVNEIKNAGIAFKPYIDKKE